MRFHEKLRELKGEMSESALADASGLPYATVHNYVLGRRKPSFSAVVKLARALGKDCLVFADCEDVGDPEKPARRASKARKPKK